MTSRLRIHNLKFIQPPPTAALPAADRSWCRRAAAPAMTRLTSAAVPAGTTCRSVRGCQPSAGCPSGHPGRRVHPRRRVATPPHLPCRPPMRAAPTGCRFPLGPTPAQGGMHTGGLPPHPVVAPVVTSRWSTRRAQTLPARRAQTLSERRAHVYGRPPRPPPRSPTRRHPWLAATPSGLSAEERRQVDAPPSFRAARRRVWSRRAVAVLGSRPSRRRNGAAAASPPGLRCAAGAPGVPRVHSGHDGHGCTYISRVRRVRLACNLVSMLAGLVSLLQCFTSA